MTLFTRQLVAVSLGLALSFATCAQEPLSILGYTSSTSFWLEIPKGWLPAPKTAKQTGAIFVLVPENFTFDTAPAVIVASSYEKTLINDAMAQDLKSFLETDPKMQVSSGRTEVAKAGARFSIREYRSQHLKLQGYESVAYHQEGPDVVVITLSAQTEKTLQEGKEVFLALLKTFESSKLKVKHE